MADRKVTYCPMCGSALEVRERFGKHRPVCPNCDHTVFFDPKVAVVAFVTQDDRVLLVKRANEPGKGRWSLPAGFVDHDEAPDSAAQRETEEETGLRVVIARLIDLLHRPDVDGLADIVIAYRADVVGGALRAGDDADDAGWFHRDELPEIALASAELLIGRWLSGTL